jgi:prolyl-tRNA synthetase
MRQSQLFYKTKKETPKEAKISSHKLLVRADFIEQTISGVYRFLPLGYRVLKKIENIIREEMVKIGGQEIYLPVLQNKNLWLETERWEKIDPPLFKLKDRHQKEIALGPTHEEEMTDIVRNRIKSYQDLPVFLFQIQVKFRNEMRASGGLLRNREFIMKDLYSFHKDIDDLARFYEKVKKAYFQIFKRCSLKAFCLEADPGTIGGKFSHEFMVISESGEDKILVCPKCGYAERLLEETEEKKCLKCKTILEKKNAIEVGHIFNLDTKYSEAMKAYFLDRDGKQKPITMGCYGIGLPRLMATIVEVHHDEKGICWPSEVAPFNFHLIPVENSQKVKKESEKLYRDLQKKGIEVLYDEREGISVGEKFVEADLIGIPWRIVVSERTLAKKSIEVKQREGKKVKLIKINNLNRFYAR